MSNSSKWWSKDTVALVTGGNKGIGFEIVKQLAKQGLTVILTSRDELRGLKAKEALDTEGIHVDFHILDVSSKESCQNLAFWIRKAYGGLDILINNASIAEWTVCYPLARSCIQTNFEGVKNVTQEILPLLKPSIAGARIVNVSSEMGKLQYFGDSLKQRLEDVSNLSPQKLDMLASEYLGAVKDGRWEGEGWPPIYMVSKALVNAYTRLLAETFVSRPDGQKIYVNCMHPGLVKTDMNHLGHLSPAEGADTAVWLALVPPEGPSGQFFYQRRMYEF